MGDCFQGVGDGESRFAFGLGACFSNEAGSGPLRRGCAVAFGAKVKWLLRGSRNPMVSGVRVVAKAGLHSGFEQVFETRLARFCMRNSACAPALRCGIWHLARRSGDGRGAALVAGRAANSVSLAAPRGSRFVFRSEFKAPKTPPSRGFPDLGAIKAGAKWAMLSGVQAAVKRACGRALSRF